MGYTFKIGNAVPEFNKDDGVLSASWVVEPAQSDSAPTFPNDCMTGNGNSRSPSYSVWSDFCQATGIYSVFYDRNGRIHGGHPGCVIISREQYERVSDAMKNWQQKATLPPGFEGFPKYDKETGSYDTPDAGKYDAYLARLMWLEFWMGWALENCETPAIENY